MLHDDEPLTDMEQETESMITMMQEIKNIQEAFKDPSGAQVSDEERRKRAEDMIMKIAAMMDLGDDGEDDDPDDDEWENLKNGISRSAAQK